MSQRKETGGTFRQKAIQDFPEGPFNDEMILAYCRSLGPPAKPGDIERAYAVANEWASKGVGAVKLDAPEPVLLFTQGPIEILTNSPLCAVVNSRKPRKIHPNDSWVRATAQMAHWAMEHGYVLATGLGARPYELTAAMARYGNRPCVIILDQPLPAMDLANKANEFWKRYGNLLPLGKTLLVSPFFPVDGSDSSYRRVKRDSLVINMAETIMVVQASAGGNMHRLALDAMACGKKVFALSPEKEGDKRSGNQVLLDAGAAEFSIKGAFPKPSPTQTRQKAPHHDEKFQVNEYLYHFTRSHPGPWPGQDLYEYYKDLIMAREDASHSALDTLCRILSERCIRGSSGLVRGNRPVVSLTAAVPDNLADLIQWRRTLARWTMEPYGLAVRRSALELLGAKPVEYGDDSVWETMPDDQRFRFQSTGKNRQWPIEQEWRLPGNLDLAQLQTDDVIVFVPSTEEKEIIESRFPYQVRLLSTEVRKGYFHK